MDFLLNLIKPVDVAASNWPLTTEPQLESQDIPFGICGTQSGNGTGFSLGALVFPNQYNSTNLPHRHILHLCTINSIECH
jgi:hypothetical protein